MAKENSKERLHKNVSKWVFHAEPQSAMAALINHGSLAFTFKVLNGPPQSHPHPLLSGIKKVASCLILYCQLMAASVSSDSQPNAFSHADFHV